VDIKDPIANIDDCGTTPCLHGGTCLDGLNSFVCQCAVGMLGNNCQNDTTTVSISGSIPLSLLLSLSYATVSASPLPAITGIIAELSNALSVSSERFEFRSFSDSSHGIIFVIDILPNTTDPNPQHTPIQLFLTIEAQLTDPSSALLSSAISSNIISAATRCPDGVVASDCVNHRIITPTTPPATTTSDSSPSPTQYVIAIAVLAVLLFFSILLILKLYHYFNSSLFRHKAFGRKSVVAVTATSTLSSPTDARTLSPV